MVSPADVNVLRLPLAKGALLPPYGILPCELTRVRDEIVGREAEIAALCQAVDSDRRVHVLTGPAGSGKTTIALAAAARLTGADVNHDIPADRKRPVSWVSARNRLSLVESLAVLAHRLNADGAELQRARELARADVLWRLIRNATGPVGPGRAVLVIDNANDPVGLAELVQEAARLPAPVWFTVITTGLSDIGSHVPGVHRAKVAPLGKDACTDLIINGIRDPDEGHRPSTRASASRTADLLGCLPLALRVAGAQQSSAVVRHTLRGYTTALANHVETAQADTAGPVRHVLLAVQIGLGLIQPAAQPAAMTVLALVASMAPAQPFPIAALEVAIAQTVADDEVPDDDVEPLLRRGWRTLGETGLVSLGVEDGVQVLTMHSLVAEAVDRLLREAVLVASVPAGFNAVALDWITDDLTRRAPDEFTLSLWRLIIPHVEHLLSRDAAADPAARRATHRAAASTVRHLLRCGLHDLAHTLADQAVELAGSVDDRENMLIATLHHGLVQQSRRRFTEAFADLGYVAQAYREQADPQRWWSAEHHLASVLYDMGKADDAARALRAVLEARTRLLGPEDPDTLATKQRLGMAVLSAGSAKDALALFTELLDARARVLGPKHPDTICTMHSRAYACQALGGRDSLRNAEVEFGAVLALRREVLGDVHPDTLVTEHNLAWIEQAKGRYAAAERRFRAVLKVQLRRLDFDHPHPVATAANLAWDLLQRRQFDTARRLFHQVLTIRRTTLTDNHPDTQTTRGNLGWLTYEEGRPDEATRILERLVRDREETLRPAHPRTLTTRHNLALSLRSQRDYDAALRQFGPIFALQKKVIGKEHESTLSTKYNLAVTLRLRDRGPDIDRAIRLLETLLDQQMTIFSFRHPTITQSREELIAARRQRGSADDLDRASDEQTPSRQAAALSRHHREREYDETPEVIPVPDPLLPAFVDRTLDEERLKPCAKSRPTG